MDIGGNVGNWEENDYFGFVAQANEQFQTMEVPLPQMGQEIGEAFKRVMQPLIPEVVEAVRLQVAQELRPFFPELVETVRLICAEQFKAFIPVMIEEMKKAVHSSGSRLLLPQAESSTSRRFQLHFVGTFPDKLPTLNNIQHEGASLEVQLRDGFGSRVEVGPESSVKIKVVVLDGDFEVEDRDDWTEEDFKANVAEPRKDRGPLLKGNCEISLSNGVAVVDNIAFTDNSSKVTKNGFFRLGIQVVKGLPSRSVREAVSKPFKVIDRRGHFHQKHEIPYLQDHIWRLVNIGEKGPILQRLAGKGIRRVKDFLQLYNTDEMELQDIAGIRGKKWQETVVHAKSCLLSDEHYRYHDDESGIVLLLDCIFNIVNVKMNSQNSQCSDTLDYSQKELVNKVRRKAYENRSNLQKVGSLTNELSVPLESVCTSTILHRNMQCANADSNNYAPPPVMPTQPGQAIDPTEDSCPNPLNLEAFIASLISNDCNVHVASTSNTRVVMNGSVELMSRRSRIKWNSVRAVVVMFKIAIKLSSKEGPRAMKRQKLG